MLCVQSTNGLLQRVKFLSTPGAPQALCPISRKTLFLKSLWKVQSNLRFRGWNLTTSWEISERKSSLYTLCGKHSLRGKSFRMAASASMRYYLYVVKKTVYLNNVQVLCKCHHHRFPQGADSYILLPAACLTYLLILLPGNRLVLAAISVKPTCGPLHT